MKSSKSIKKLEIIGFIVTSIIGTLLHFAYDWSNKAFIVGLFTPVNESPWEHLKLIFFPFILYGIYESKKLENDKFNVFTAKLIGVLSAIMTTLAIFYVVNGALGKVPDFVNIISYFVGMAVGFLVSYLFIKNSIGKGSLNGISLATIIVIAIMFVFLTVYPIKIPLFQDPQNFTFGIMK